MAEAEKCREKLRKDYPLTDPGAAMTQTISVKKTGPQSPEMIWKIDGEVNIEEALSASADGKGLVLLADGPMLD